MSATLFNPVGQVEQAATPPVRPPVKPPVVPAPVVQKQTVPVVQVQHPPMVKPQGPPVAPLLPLGWAGTIQQFNQTVQAIHDQAVKINGIPPDPATMLSQAIAKPPTSEQFSIADNLTLGGPPVLKALIGNAKAGGYGAFMEQHGDQVNALLTDPSTRAEATAALAVAKQYDTTNQIEERGGPLSSVTKDLGVAVGEAPFKAAKKIAQTVWATDKDVKLADTYVISRGKEGSLSFPHLTETAPAVAQVVKGLVYSPAGLVDVGKAVGEDVVAAAHGDFAFKNTVRIAEQTKNQFLLDLAHPQGRAGYLALDLFGFASLGAGAAARFGRVGSALGEDASIGTALKAGVAPHPLRTVTLSKGDFSENVSLAMSPLAQLIQQYAPVIGLKARQAALDSDTAGETLAGDPLVTIGPNDPVTRFVKNALAPERTIGRAGDIRRGIENKAAMGLRAMLDQAIGSGVRQTVVGKLLPDSWEMGLTKGEVKAIQALSWDDPNPLSAEEHFHQQMLEQGVGNPVAHKQAIAELGLARQALENPSPRFQSVLDHVVRITAETQKMRIDLGLSEGSAENRIARAGAILRDDDVVKLPDGEWGFPIKDRDGNVVDMVPLNRATPDSWYTPISLKTKGQRVQPRSGPVARGPSSFGIGPPVPLTEIRHEMTGDALRNGDFRTDAHHLAGEGYARTVKASQALNEWQRAWKGASVEKTSDHDIAVRDVKSIPDELRKAVSDFSEGHISQQDVEKLPASIHEMLFPENPTDIENVRWIDPRLLGQQAIAPKPLGPAEKFMEKVNNVLRPAIFYNTPKYALNAVGNAAMLAFDQGFMRSGSNFAKAISAKDNLSEEAYGRLLSETGSSRSESYVNPASGKVSKALADFWNNFTDKHFRAASFLHYANRAGYKSWDQIESLLMDEKNPDHVDVNKRADDAMVAFDRMTPFEKASIRHYIFVYPWQRGAFFWTLRSIFEHPAKTALLATLGQEAYTDDKWLKTVPAWIRRTGYIPLWTSHDGNPVVVNPLSINTFSTLADVVTTLKGGVEGDKYASVGDLFGPGAQFLVHGALGVDQNGNPYKGSQWLGSAEDVLNILPLLSAEKRSTKGAGAPLKPANIADRSSLEARLNSALHQTTLSPGWLDGYGQLIGGGLLTPRELNLTGLAARYWAAATPEEKQQREVDLLRRALNMQGEYLKRPVPEGVKQAVTDAAQLTHAYTLQAQALGRTPTAKEKLLTTIKYLKDAGRVPAKTAMTLTSRATGLATLPDINQMHAAVMTLYGHVNDLRNWDGDVSTLVSLERKSDFSQRLATLYQNGLTKDQATKTSTAQRLAYGRQYVAYLDGRRDLAKQVKGRPDAAAQLRIYDDEHDQPVNARPAAFVLPGQNPGLVGKGNIDFANRQVAHNPDGSISTVRTISIGVGNREVLIPTVVDGKVVSDQAAIAYYKQTGQNLGSFKNVASANAYSVRLHDEQAKLYASGNSGQLPSVARFRFTEGNTQAQQQRIDKLAAQPWGSLSASEKAALGRDVPTNLSEAWASFHQTISAARAKGISVGADQKIGLAKEVNTEYPGFSADYAYSLKPGAERFEQTTLYQRLPDRSWFESHVLQPAKALAATIKQNGNAGYYKRYWKEYVTSTIQPALDKSDLGTALKLFGKNFLTGLV